MFKKDIIKEFILGFITYFVLGLILDLFGVDTILVKTSIILIIYVIAQLQKKHTKS